MKRLGTLIGVVAALGLLGILLIGGYSMFKHLVSMLDTLGPQGETIVGVASVVALLCAVIIAWGYKAGWRNAAYPERASGYERLLSIWCRSLGMSGADLGIEREIAELERALALHGGAKVISAHLALRRAKENDDELNELLQKLAVAMREDIRGQEETWLDKNQLLDLLLSRHPPKA